MSLLSSGSDLESGRSAGDPGIRFGSGQDAIAHKTPMGPNEVRTTGLSGVKLQSRTSFVVRVGSKRQ